MSNQITKQLTVWLIPRSRVLEKLTITQLFKKQPNFYGTQRFSIMFTRVHHCSLP